MAGKKHHHIWRMLQRGFGTKRGKDHHVWVYSREEESKRSGTGNHGVENYYYSSEGDHQADDILTQFENEVQGRLQNARNAADGTLVDSDFMAPIVAHIEMRSNFLRCEMSRLSSKAVEVIEGFFSSRTRSKKLILEYINSNPELLERELGRLGIAEIDKAILRSYLDCTLPSLVDENSAKLSDGTLAIIGTVKHQLSKIVKDAHLTSLSGGFTEIDRAKKHVDFRYTIRRTEEAIILPDNCIAFLKNEGAKPLTQKRDKVTDIIFPLASNTFIHGVSSGSFDRNTKTLNRVLASCAYGTFIADNDDDQFKKLTKYIGKNAKLLSKNEINNALSFDRLLENMRIT